jgi:hypothetical protein
MLLLDGTVLLDAVSAGLLPSASLRASLAQFRSHVIGAYMRDTYTIEGGAGYKPYEWDTQGS